MRHPFKLAIMFTCGYEDDELAGSGIDYIRVPQAGISQTQTPGKVRAMQSDSAGSAQS